MKFENESRYLSNVYRLTPLLPIAAIILFGYFMVIRVLFVKNFEVEIQ